MTPAEWKAFYAREREQLGAAGLSALFERAPRVALPAGGAIVFPHTKLEASGWLVAAAARAVIESGARRVLAIGVRHGARSGARAIFDEVEGEFSLDNFGVLLDVAAARAGVKAPELITRFPFLAGESPETLPRFDALRELAADGSCAIVATADPIHYGIGYGQPTATLARDSEEARSFAAREIEKAFADLSARNYAGFLAQAERVRSDFKDAGPTLAALLDRPFAAKIEALELVDYGDVFGAPQPTWVAGALVVLS